VRLALEAAYVPTVGSDIAYGPQGLGVRLTPRASLLCCPEGGHCLPPLAACQPGLHGCLAGGLVVPCATNMPLPARRHTIGFRQAERWAPGPTLSTHMVSSRATSQVALVNPDSPGTSVSTAQVASTAPISTSGIKAGATWDLTGMFTRRVQTNRCAAAQHLGCFRHSVNPFLRFPPDTPQPIKSG